MIGRWAKAGALLVLGSALVVDLGLAAGLLEDAPRDLPAAWRALAAVAGPGARLAVGGRDAIRGGAVAGVTAAAVASLVGCAAAALSRPAAAVLVGSIRVPALTLLVLGLLVAVLLVDASGPVTAALAGFSVATAALGPRWTLAVVLLPVAVAIVERAARRLDRMGFQSLASLGLGPLRRLLGVALPGVLPAAVRAAVMGFLIAASCLFVAAWPAPARHEAVARAAAGFPAASLATAAFCVAMVLALAIALLSALRGYRDGG